VPEKLEPYFPFRLPEDTTVVLTILAAAKRVAKMEALDNHCRAPLSLQLRTVISALGAGLGSKDWQCVAEALVMVTQVEVMLRQLEAKVPIDIR
jgi:hypothetical protein